MLATVFKHSAVIFFCSILMPFAAMAYDEHSGPIITETWGPGTHYVTASVTVSDNEVLTILPGAVVKFAPNTQLLVYGTLNASGTGDEAENGIVFTSRDDDSLGETIVSSDGSAAPGDWHGIYVYGGGDNDGIGEFDYSLFRYGGYAGGATDANVLFYSSNEGYLANCISEHSHQHGIRIQECSPQITDSTFRDNALSGLYASGSGTPTISGNDFIDNGQYAAHLNQAIISPLISNNTGSGNQINALAFRGDVTADQTWTSTPGFPIVLLSSVTVRDNVRLTITADTVIKFDGNYQLLVYGTLDANGSEDSRVVFTSLKDDDHDGDTNGDGDVTTPSPGDWHGIYVYGGGDNDGIGEFDYCLFRYGGYAGGAIDANVLFYSSNEGYLANCISEHSHQHGVRIQECSPIVFNSTLANNTSYGINVSSGDPWIRNSIVWGNGNGAISGVATIDYSDIQGGYSGVGNIDADPLFIIPSGDYHLDICSPAIDAGDPVEILTADYSVGELVITVDGVTAISPGDTIWITDGENLESDDVFSAMGETVTVSNGFLNSYSVANRSYLFTATSDFTGEPAPNGRRINMGAYGGGSDSVPSLVCRADLEGDDLDVDGADLFVFLAALSTSSGDPKFNADADFNSDGTVSIIDLAALAEEFGRTDCLACP
jgi:parallel beta-helix repeat protein